MIKVLQKGRPMDFKNLINPNNLQKPTDKTEKLIQELPPHTPSFRCMDNLILGPEISKAGLVSVEPEPITGIIEPPPPPRLLLPSDQGWHRSRIENLDPMAYMSNSKIKAVFESDRTFYRRYIRGIKSKDTPSRRLGRIVHSAILEPADFKRRYVIMPEFEGKGSKARKEDFITSLPQDAIVLTEDDVTKITYMIESVYEHPRANDLLAKSTNEKHGYFYDKNTDWWWYIIPDFMRATSQRIMLGDVKSAQSAKVEDFGRDYFNYGYYIQEAIYTDISKIFFGHDREYLPFSFIVVENQEPFTTEVITMPSHLVEMGRQIYINKSKYLKKMLAKSTIQKDWHGYSGSTAIKLGDIPFWATKQIENNPKYFLGE